MQYNVYQINHGSCPYLPEREWLTYTFAANYMDPAAYEKLLKKGFRRSGSHFYLNSCTECIECIPIRISAKDFRPSKSQRKVIRKNQDISISRRAAGYTDESFELYRKYNEDRHNSTEGPNEDDYIRFLCTSPITSEMVEYRLEGTLVGCGWIDLLPKGISSVYYAFDPEWGSRSLGTYSIIKEIEMCLKLEKPWYYLGFYVPKCRKMEYKADFTPHQLFQNGRWGDPAEQPYSF
jgi:leucyl-tRNA---protein transferase